MTSQPFSTTAAITTGFGRSRPGARRMRLATGWPGPTRAQLTARNSQLGSALAASTAQLQRQAAELRHQADELRASRARIVTAADAERRRIERNLHDGSQQRLAALAIKLNLAAELAGPGAGEVRSLLAELRHDVRDTAEELRHLAHGIYPPLLAECGLAAALTAAAGRSAIPAQVGGASVGRYPPEVEATVYFCCLEAIQNAGKHAGPGAALAVRLRAEAGQLSFEVADDGTGFDPGQRGHGAGFLNMTDRVRALGGSLLVESAPGRGTVVKGTVPCGPA